MSNDEKNVHEDHERPKHLGPVSQQDNTVEGLTSNTPEDPTTLNKDIRDGEKEEKKGFLWVRLRCVIEEWHSIPKPASQKS